MANHTHRYLYHAFFGGGGGGGNGQITLMVTCIIVSWVCVCVCVGGGGGFRYPITDLPPPNDVHNLQSLQGARRKLTSQFDYYLHLDIVTPREREKLSLLQQTNVTISNASQQIPNNAQRNTMATWEP